jgi:hypothetical protein
MKTSPFLVRKQGFSLRKLLIFQALQRHETIKKRNLFYSAPPVINKTRNTSVISLYKVKPKHRTVHQNQILSWKQVRFSRSAQLPRIFSPFSSTQLGMESSASMQFSSSHNSLVVPPSSEIQTQKKFNWLFSTCWIRARKKTPKLFCNKLCTKPQKTTYLKKQTLKVNSKCGIYLQRLPARHEATILRSFHVRQTQLPVISAGAN